MSSNWWVVRRWPVVQPGHLCSYDDTEVLSSNIYSRIYYFAFKKETVSNKSSQLAIMSSTPKPPPDGDVNIGYRLTAVVIVTFSLAAIAVTMRIYTRARLVRKVGWDDWLILFAVVGLNLRFCKPSSDQMSLTNIPVTRPDRFGHRAHWRLLWRPRKT